MAPGKEERVKGGEADVVVDAGAAVDERIGVVTASKRRASMLAEASARPNLRSSSEVAIEES